VSAIDREKLRSQVGIQLTDVRVDEWVRGMHVPLHGREVSVDLQSRYLAATIRAAVLALIDAAPALPAGLPDVERLAAALHAGAFGMKPKRIEDYNPDDFYREYAVAVRAALEGSSTLPSDR
jgi:hypothetical protein